MPRLRDRIAGAIAALVGSPACEFTRDRRLDARLDAIEASLGRIEDRLPTAENLMRALERSRRERN